MRGSGTSFSAKISKLSKIAIFANCDGNFFNFFLTFLEFFLENLGKNLVVSMAPPPETIKFIQNFVENGLKPSYF